MNPLNDDEVAQKMPKIPQWKQAEGGIQREVRLPNYLDAVSVFEAIAKESERVNHHPEVWIGWRVIRISLITHSAHGLTEKDFDLAQRFDEILSNLL